MCGGGVRSLCVRACCFPTDLPASETSRVTWMACPHPPRSPSLSSDHFIRSRAPERRRLRFQCGGIPTVLLHVDGAVMPPDRRALQPGLRFSHPSVIPHLGGGGSEKETTHINMVEFSVHIEGEVCEERIRGCSAESLHVEVDDTHFTEGV